MSNHTRRQIFSLVIFFITICCAHSKAAQEINIGRLYTHQAEVAIDLADCGRAWVIAENSASCHVQIFQLQNAFLSYPLQTLNYWEYQSAERWRIAVYAERTEKGYAIQLKGVGDVPNEHWQFSVAKKYIESAFRYGSIESPGYAFKTQLISTTAQSVGFQSQPLIKVRRSLPFKDEAVTKRCVQGLYEIDSKKICVFHMANYFSGEMILSFNHLTASAQSVDASQKITINMKALPVWQDLQGASSLAYLHSEFRGEYTPDMFERLYSQATRSLPDSGFVVDVAKPDSLPNENALYREQRLGNAFLARREFEFDFQSCERTWVVEDGEARCRLPNSWLSSRIGPNKSLAAEGVVIGDRYAFMSVNVKQQEYEFKMSASAEVLNRFSTASEFIKKMMQKQPNGKLYEFSLVAN